MTGSGPTSGMGIVEPERELRTWPATRRSLSAALRWWVWSVVLAPMVIGGAALLIDVARGSTPLSSRLVLAIPVAYLGGLLAGALIIVGALGCLPFFMIVSWFVACVPWVDRSMSGAIVLCLLL